MKKYPVFGFVVHMHLQSVFALSGKVVFSNRFLLVRWAWKIVIVLVYFFLSRATKLQSMHSIAIHSCAAHCYKLHKLIECTDFHLFCRDKWKMNVWSKYRFDDAAERKSKKKLISHPFVRSGHILTIQYTCTRYTTVLYFNIHIFME